MRVCEALKPTCFSCGLFHDAKRQGCDRIVCLGDIVGYGYAPNECVDLVKDRCDAVVIGNHDAAVARKIPLRLFTPVAAAGVIRDRAKISDERAEWLGNLPFQLTERCVSGNGCVGFAHGDLDGELEFPYVENGYDAVCTSTRMKMRMMRLLFIGHTHYAIGYGIGKGAVIAINPSKGAVSTDIRPTLILNVGSVGYPRNQPWSVYAIYDDSANTVAWRQLKFDFVRYCCELRRAGIEPPDWMYRWVDEGFLSESEMLG